MYVDVFIQANDPIDVHLMDAASTLLINQLWNNINDNHTHLRQRNQLYSGYLGMKWWFLVKRKNRKKWAHLLHLNIPWMMNLLFYPIHPGYLQSSNKTLFMNHHLYYWIISNLHTFKSTFFFSFLYLCLLLCLLSFICFYAIMSFIINNHVFLWPPFICLPKIISFFISTCFSLGFWLLTYTLFIKWRIWFNTIFYSQKYMSVSVA